MARFSEKTMLERFEEKFIPVTESGCWIWTAGTHNRGYGHFHTGRKDQRRGKCEMAHRLAYELYHGYRPKPNECVCHKCDTPLCVNPAHLFIGSHRDNMEDMANKGRSGRHATIPESVILDIILSEDSLKNLSNKYAIDAGYCSRLKNRKTKRARSVYEKYHLQLMGLNHG